MDAKIEELIASRCNLFITGAAGTGKSHLTREIISRLCTYTYVTAPTGIAAIQVGGMTFHRLCRMGLCTGTTETIQATIDKREDMKKQWLETDTIVIDEISMMDVSLFIRVGKAVGNIRYKYGKCKEVIPFGGIRLIVVGDFYQIAPIQPHVEEVEEDGEIMRKTYTYLFQHAIWQELAFKPIVLTKPMRYIKDGIIDEEGVKFASILADVRKGILSQQVIEMVKACSIKPNIHIVHTDEGDMKIIPTMIIATNKEVDDFNEKQLATLKGEERSYESVYKASSSDCIISREDLIKHSLVPCPLRLKIGAQVMLLKNIPERNLANGSRGVVSGFTDDNLPIVTFIDGQSLIVEWHTLTKTARRGIDERGEPIKDKASLTYIPLRLAYAITINKSQGITLDSAYLSLDTCFAPGHLYVALSRCRSMKNIYIKSWSMHAFNKCKPLQCVHDFYTSLESLYTQ